MTTDIDKTLFVRHIDRWEPQFIISLRVTYVLLYSQHDRIYKDTVTCQRGGVSNKPTPNVVARKWTSLST